MGRRAPLIAVAAVLLATGCHHGDGEKSPAGIAALVSGAPLTSPGFPPTGREAAARLAALKVEWGRNWQTYKRENFGRYWSDETDALGGRNGCDTRVISMLRAMVEPFSQRAWGIGEGAYCKAHESQVKRGA
ncbi:hypothetical protein ACFWBH_15745 [Streptomyces sp. NPDC059999]|uniref:hypothetical protein n=1 Tax=Streptomyces sp. NPDC059999 TaxID=3347030 RepID=UPI003689CCA8